MSKNLSLKILAFCSGLASLSLLLAVDPAFAKSNNGNGNGSTPPTQTTTPTTSTQTTTPTTSTQTTTPTTSTQTTTPTTSTQTVAPTQSATPSTSSFTVGLADLGKIFRINFDGNVDTKTVNGLSSFADFTFRGFTSQGGNTIAKFDVLLDNTTSGGILSRVSGLGFNTSATVTGASSTGLLNNGVIGGKFPNQFGDIGVCFTDGPNCSGGASGGVNNIASLPGTFDKGTFSFSLELNGNVNTLKLDNFGVRYQSIDAKSVGVSGTSGTGRGTVGEPTLPAPTPTPPAPTPTPPAPTPTPPAPTPTPPAPTPTPPAPTPTPPAPTPTPPAPTPTPPAPTPTPPAPTPTPPAPTPTPPAPQPPLFDKPIDGTLPTTPPTTPPVSQPTPPKPTTPKPKKVPEPGMAAALALVSSIAFKYRKQQETDTEA